MTKRKPKNFRWQSELDIAKTALWGEPGRLEIATDQYVAFRYIEPNLRLVFYPHRTTAGHYHLRIRFEGCKDELRADMLAKRLDDAAGHNCTFSKKWSYKAFVAGQKNLGHLGQENGTDCGNG